MSIEETEALPGRWRKQAEKYRDTKGMTRIERDRMKVMADMLELCADSLDETLKPTFVTRHHLQEEDDGNDKVRRQQR